MNADRDKVASALCQNLGPEYLSWRRGNGSQQAYIEGHTVITLANEIFGFDGWSSEVRSTAVEFEKSGGDGRWQIGVRCIMRITLRKSGVFREDVGFGQALNMASKLQALEKAHKEAATDATKRAFRQFGNALGNCIYDKTHTNAVTSVNALKREFDPSALRRPGPPPPSKRVAVAYNPPGEAKKANYSTPTPISKVVLPSENDDDDDIDFTRLQPPARPAITEPSVLADIPPGVSAASESTPAQDTASKPEVVVEDAVFVSANNADAYNSPKPLTSDTHFNPDYRSPSIKTTLPQNYSGKVFRRT